MSDDGLDLKVTEAQLLRAAHKSGVCLQALFEDAGKNFSGNSIPKPNNPLTDAELEWVATIED